MPFTIDNSIAPSTRRNRSQVCHPYESFCRKHGYTTFPTSIKPLTHWTAIVMRTAKPDTAKSYISTIRSIHIEKGITPSIFNDPRIDLVIRGGKRMYGEGTKRIRLPLTASILHRILPQLRATEQDINVKAALLCGVCRLFTMWRIYMG